MTLIAKKFKVMIRFLDNSRNMEDNLNHLVSNMAVSLFPVYFLYALRQTTLSRLNFVLDNKMPILHSPIMLYSTKNSFGISPCQIVTTL